MTREERIADAAERFRQLEDQMKDTISLLRSGQAPELLDRLTDLLEAHEAWIREYSQED